MAGDQSIGDSSTPGLRNVTDGSVTARTEMLICNISTNITENCTKLFTQSIEENPSAIIVPILFGIIFIVGVIGNGTIIYTVARNKVMRNVPNVLIVSLSVGDLLLIIVSVPFSATIFTFQSWPYGESICKFNEYMQTLSLGVSIFTLTALSADRYVAIVDPMSHHTGNTLAKAVIVVGVIWGASIVLAIPDGIAANVSDSPRGDGTWSYVCSPYPLELIPLYPRVISMTKFMVYFAVPVVTIAFFYLMMARILIRSGQSMPCEGNSARNQQRQIAARKKVAKVVLSFVLIFLVCWLPRHIYILWYWFDAGLYNDFWHAFQIFGFCLTFINSCVNPFALYFLSSQFRKFYNRYLFCCIPADRVYNPLEPTSTMHNFNSTVRRASSTTATMVQSMSQSMC